jgi:hypothetical protein
LRKPTILANADISTTMAEPDCWEDLDDVPSVSNDAEDVEVHGLDPGSEEPTASQSDLTNTLHWMDVLMQPRQFDDREDKPMILLDWTSYSQGEITPANAGDADALYRRLTETLWQSWDEELEEMFEAGQAWHTTDLRVRTAQGSGHTCLHYASDCSGRKTSGISKHKSHHTCSDL